MIRMKAEMIGQPHEMAIGPPLFHAWPKVVKHPARIEMIENEIAKLEKLDQLPAQLLRVAEPGEVLLVVGQLAFTVGPCSGLCSGHGRTSRGVSG